MVPDLRVVALLRDRDTARGQGTQAPGCRLAGPVRQSERFRTPLPRFADLADFDAD